MVINDDVDLVPFIQQSFGREGFQALDNVSYRAQLRKAFARLA